MTYPPPGPYTTQPGMPPPYATGSAKTSTTGPTVMVIFGIVALVATVVCLVLAIYSGTKLAEVASSYEPGNESVTGDTTVISGLHLTGAETYSLGCVTSVDPQGVSVTGEGGSADSSVSVRVPSGSTSTTIDGSLFHTQVIFTPDNTGDYRVRVQGTDGVVPSCMVGKYLAVGTMVGSVFTMTMSIIGTVFFFVIGVGLTIGGVVWLSSRRKAARRVQTTTPGRV